MITLKEIASKCSVSIATVSNILNGKSNVSEETKQRVLQVIQETGYKPNFLARGLRASKTKTVGLLIDDLSEFSCPPLVEGIMAYLEEYDYKSILENLRFYSKWGKNWYKYENYHDDVTSAIQEFEAIKVDGIIYVAGHCRNIQAIPKNLRIPTVICYAFNEDRNFSSVIFNDEQAAFQMTEHLIKNGHRNIAVIQGAKDNMHTKARLKGFLKAMKENNISVNEQLLYNGDWTLESGYSSCKNIIENGQNPTVIFCFNDLMAAGAYGYLSTTNIKPGEDIAIAGFDNRPVSSILNPPLTTMEIPLKEIGQKSAELLINQLNSDSPLPVQEVLMPCNLVERNSITNII